MPLNFIFENKSFIDSKIKFKNVDLKVPDYILTTNQ